MILFMATSMLQNWSNLKTGENSCHHQVFQRKYGACIKFQCLTVVFKSAVTDWTFWPPFCPLGHKKGQNLPMSVFFQELTDCVVLNIYYDIKSIKNREWSHSPKGPTLMCWATKIGPHWNKTIKFLHTNFPFNLQHFWFTTFCIWRWYRFRNGGIL